MGAASPGAAAAGIVIVTFPLLSGPRVGGGSVTTTPSLAVHTFTSSGTLTFDA
jgi:hypothetical protein